MNIKVSLNKHRFTAEELEVIADALQHYQRYCRFKRKVPRAYGKMEDNFDLAHLCVSMLAKIE